MITIIILFIAFMLIPIAFTAGMICLDWRMKKFGVRLPEDYE